MSDNKLKSGRTYEYREATGLDDIACSQITGEGQTQETLEGNVLGHMTLQQATMMVLTLEEYDGKSVPQPASLSDVLDFAKKCPLRDWNELYKLYMELNHPDLGK